MLKRFVLIVAVVLSGASILAYASPQPAYAQSCSEPRLLTLPPWYRGLPRDNSCQPRLIGPADVWRVALNITEWLIQIAGYLAGFFVLWGGIQYIISIGEPAKVASAKNTISNALIGLIVAMMAVAIVSLIAGVTP